MHSKATTVEKYISELPDDRRHAISVLRDVILKNLDKGFEEGMSYGMIGYHVPHRLYPNGYHCDPRQPLPFAGLASQKQHISVYLMCNYLVGAEDKRFRAAWKKTGKKLDMGKCCIRFRKLEDAALDVIGDAIKRVRLKDYIAWYESSLQGRDRRATKSGTKRATKPASGKKRKRATSKAR